MKIVVENYLIELDQRGGYNLVEVKHHQEGKNTGKEYLVDLGYNMTLKRALLKLIEHKVSKVNTTLSLEGFLELYRNETDKVVKMVDNYTKAC